MKSKKSVYNKRGIKKKPYLNFTFVLIFVILLMLLSYNLIQKKITGYASSQPTNLTITISGVYPLQITYVSNTSATSPEPGTNKSIVFYATAKDNDGVADINISSIRADFNMTGEAKRNGTCTFVNTINALSANFSCAVDMWYWDSNGVWNVNVSGTDLGNLSRASNYTANFTYNILKSMVIFPDTLTWPAISPNATNQTSNNDPTIVNNTGNYNVTIDVTGIDLYGQSDVNYAIYAANFTVGITTGATNPECIGIALANATLKTITGSVANRGNLSLNSGAGKQNLSYCIPRVPFNLSSQTYSTTVGGSWTIGY